MLLWLAGRRKRKRFSVAWGRLQWAMAHTYARWWAAAPGRGGTPRRAAALALAAAIAVAGALGAAAVTPLVDGLVTTPGTILWAVAECTNKVPGAEYYCQSMSGTYGDMPDWDTSRVTDMSNLFNGNTFIISPDLSAWDTSLVTTMDNMFDGAIKFIGDVTSWNTSSLTTSANMYSGATDFLAGWTSANSPNGPPDSYRPTASCNATANPPFAPTFPANPSLAGEIGNCTGVIAGFATCQPTAPLNSGVYVSGPSRCEYDGSMSNTTLLECPGGYTCEGGTAGPVVCQEGQYCSAGSWTYIACYWGYLCPEGSEARIPCNTTVQDSNGKYMYCDGGAVPWPCTGGYYCPDSSTETMCPEGTFCDAGVNTWSPCPAGHKCTANTMIPVDCDETNTEGKQNHCPEGSTTETICASGTYCSDSRYNATCTVNHYCPEGVSAPIPCPAGVICPAGTASLDGLASSGNSTNSTGGGTPSGGGGTPSGVGGTPSGGGGTPSGGGGTPSGGGGTPSGEGGTPSGGNGTNSGGNSTGADGNSTTSDEGKQSADVAAPADVADAGLAVGLGAGGGILCCLLFLLALLLLRRKNEVAAEDTGDPKEP